MPEISKESDVIQKELYRLTRKIKENNWRFKMFLRLGIIFLFVVVWSIFFPDETGRLSVIYDLVFILLVLDTGYLYLLGYKVKLDLLRSRTLQISLNKQLPVDSKQISRCDARYLEQIWESGSKDDEAWG